MDRNYKLVVNRIPSSGIGYIDALAEALAKRYPEAGAALVFHRDRFRILDIRPKAALRSDEWSYQKIGDALVAYEGALLAIPPSRLLKVIRRLYKPDIPKQLGIETIKLQIDYSLSDNGSDPPSGEVKEKRLTSLDDTPRMVQPNPVGLDELLQKAASDSPISKSEAFEGLFAKH